MAISVHKRPRGIRHTGHRILRGPTRAPQPSVERRIEDGLPNRFRRRKFPSVLRGRRLQPRLLGRGGSFGLRSTTPPFALGAVSCRRVGKLTAAKKAALPDSAFGLPKERSFPMPDPSHARNAKARAKQSLKRGQLSREQYNRIVRKADRVIASCSRSRKPRRKK